MNWDEEWRLLGGSDWGSRDISKDTGEGTDGFKLVISQNSKWSRDGAYKCIRESAGRTGGGVIRISGGGRERVRKQNDSLGDAFDLRGSYVHVLEEVVFYGYPRYHPLILWGSHIRQLTGFL